MNVARWSLALVLMCFSASLVAESKWRTYRTYVHETQEYRKSTRWTLTEWLRIKERMKMMDVWLAMFSDPNKDKSFRPELNLNYGIHNGQFSVTGTNNHEADLTGKYARVQLWLTNIITGTLGIRMLNIEIGAEGYWRISDNALDLLTGDADTYEDPVLQNISAQHYSGNIRLFGKSIQDSSIVAKYGQYEVINTLHLGENLFPATPMEGVFLGAEVQFYLFKAFGLESNYHEYQKAENEESTASLIGSYIDYGAYLEISLFRLMFGKYEENWTVTDPNGAYDVKGSGYTAGLKLQF
ncbi:hypothetical protein N9D31_00605 [Oligoflexaceae bacterium]|nr:hypothetical protein [Oligoflexaceae bacterium]